MEILIILLSLIFIIFYLSRPTSKYEEEKFNSKDNWRGGF